MDSTRRDFISPKLEMIVGSASLHPTSTSDNVDGVEPQVVIGPGSEAEVADVLRMAGAEGMSVIPRGGGTKLSWGNRPGSADLILSLHRLNGVLEHAAGDMTVTVQAGITLQNL